MTSAIQTSLPLGSSLLRSFRFEGLEVGQSGALPTPAGDGLTRCDVLLAVDLAGSASAALAQLLADAGRRLGADGVLLLALPNRFGLRFWSGCPEPASGRLFTTLSGAGASPAAPVEPADRPRQFVSRRELSQALGRNGFTALEWFFAVPDGGETGASGSLISERLVAVAPELAADLATARPSADRLRPRLDLFPEALVCRELARSGLFAEFANYFLVAAALGPAGPEDAGARVWQRLRPPAPEVGWHFAAGRREPIATVFELGPAGITVGKRRVAGPDAQGPLDLAAFRWRAPEIAPLSAGDPLRLRLQEHLVAGRSAQFLDELVLFCAAMRQRFANGEDLSGAALDATLTNAMREPSGVFHLFDLEWEAAAGVPLSWWVLRNVLACLAMRGPRMAGVATGGDLYAELCQRLAVAPRLAADLEREAEFGAVARAVPRPTGAALLSAAIGQPWPVAVAQGLDPAELRAVIEATAAHQQLVAEYRKLELWAAETRDKNAAIESAYRRLESWAMEVQQANEAVLADYRKLAQWATSLEAELQRRDSGQVS